MMRTTEKKQLWTWKRSWKIWKIRKVMEIKKIAKG